MLGDIHLTDLQQWLEHMKDALPDAEWARARGAVTGLTRARQDLAEIIAYALGDLRPARLPMSSRDIGAAIERCVARLETLK